MLQINNFNVGVTETGINVLVMTTEALIKAHYDNEGNLTSAIGFENHISLMPKHIQIKDLRNKVRRCNTDFENSSPEDDELSKRIYETNFTEFEIYKSTDGIEFRIRDDVADYPNWAIMEITKEKIPNLINALQSYLAKDIDTKTIQSVRARFGGNASLPVGGYPDSDKVLNETN